MTCVDFFHSVDGSVARGCNALPDFIAEAFRESMIIDATELVA